MNKPITIAGALGAAVLLIAAHQSGRKAGEQASTKKAAREREAIIEREREIAEAHRRGALEAEQQVARQRRRRRLRKAKETVERVAEKAREVSPVG